MKYFMPAFFCSFFCSSSCAQDSTATRLITLSEVVINNKLNVPVFIARIKNDSSF